MEKIKIELTLNQWTAVLQLLAQGRFIDVADLIAAIKQQADQVMAGNKE